MYAAVPAVLVTGPGPEPLDFAEITRQFVLIDQHARDAKTGLLYHGWDETKQQPWANPETGDSPSLGRAAWAGT